MLAIEPNHRASSSTQWLNTKNIYVHIYIHSPHPTHPLILKCLRWLSFITFYFMVILRLFLFIWFIFMYAVMCNPPLIANSYCSANSSDNNAQTHNLRDTESFGVTSSAWFQFSFQKFIFHLVFPADKYFCWHYRLNFCGIE